MSVNSFEDLHVWKTSMDMVDIVYSIAGKFPRDELYGLTSQVKRSAVSVPSNISEGSSRGSPKEFIRFIYISRGSLSELRTQMIIAKRQGFISENVLKEILSCLDEISRMLVGLIRSLRVKVA